MGKAGLLVSVIVAVAVSGSAAVQRSGGASPFAPPVAVDVGGRSGDIALADLNRDGHLDLLVPRGQEAAVHFGNGRGAFAAGEAVPLPVGSGAITLGDLTGDRVPDLVVAYRSEGREYVGVMSGDGRGRFRRTTSSYVTGTAFAFYKPVLRVVDINEDGRPDIVSANGRRNSLEILIGDGRGAFTIGPRVMLEAGDFHTFGIADMDGDGHLDVVSSSHGTGLDRVGLRRGDGTGRFADRVVLPVSRNGLAPFLLSPRPDARVIGLADVTGDARADVILAHAEASWLSVLVNAGSGTFTPAAGSPYALPADAFEAAVADLNGDRNPDLVLTVVDSRTKPYIAKVVILQGDGRSFAPAPGSPIPVGRGAYNLAAGDVNGDGKLDVATSSFEGDPVMLLHGR